MNYIIIIIIICDGNQAILIVEIETGKTGMEIHILLFLMIYT